MTSPLSHLIVGGDSSIGAVLFRYLRTSGERVLVTTRRPSCSLSRSDIFLDLNNVADFAPPSALSVAYLAAGVTPMEACRLRPELTRVVNVTNTLEVAKRLVEAGVFVIFLSSNLVFDGSKPYCKETDPQDRTHKEEALRRISELLLTKGHDIEARATAARCLSAMGADDEALRAAATAPSALPEEIGRELVFRAARRKLPVREKVIVFLQLSSFRLRAAKMARALRKVGWTAVLVSRDATEGIPEGCFDEVHRVNDPGRMLTAVASCRPRICHIGDWSGSPFLLTLLREKLWKTVIDPTDYHAGLSDFTGWEFEQMYQTEAIRLADGLCARDTRPGVMRRELKIPFPRRVIHFPDYCWDEEGFSFLERERLPGIHVVSAGSIPVKSDAHHLEAGFVLLSKKFAELGIHLHFYPSEAHGGVNGSLLEKNYGPLMELERQTGFIHVHNPLKPVEVPQALSKYHFGIRFFIHSLTGRPYPGFNSASVRHGGPARLPDYIDAGLFIVSNADCRHSTFLFERGGVLVRADLPFIENPLPVLQRKLASSNFEDIARFRRKFSSDAHVRRLEAFYDSL